ncbi:hypothetical protein CHS0354_036667 [Potamilus streckersoni]|uniref:Rapamycin-insensitive companion of mTOR n=1 Tax=Potamilus streckersoni TaxID=2493646 RepID=A0AAE0TH63_9BIVA|nr:hypothetical protein CHS0354_036667 [Potamilus streckersoni]
MAASMVRQHNGRQLRSNRFRVRHTSGEDCIQLDLNRDPAENIKEIFTHVLQQDASKARKLGYLNAFVRLLQKWNSVTPLGYSKQDILLCLRVILLERAKEVRAATLRVIKHFLMDDETVAVVLDLHMDFLIARSLDICLDNEVERIHAQKLVRKIIHLVPHLVPSSLVYPLVSIGNDGAAERDRMVRISMATICELAYHNPELVSQCGGISMILRKVLDCHQYPRINESLVCTILHLLNHPRTRHLIRFNTDLEQLLAPFTDCHFSYNADQGDQNKDDREGWFAASKMAIVTVMRSWPGLIRFCRPEGTGLQSLVGILYLPFLDIRQGIIELIYELFHLTVPEWTSDFSAALLSVAPSQPRENWRLTDGFVAEEGKNILPHMAKIRPNLVENHLALLLAAWIGAGLLDALVEVLISSDGELFVKTVILMGGLLHMANQLLPAECVHYSHYLSSLMALASSFNIPNRERHQASVAVTYLNRIHALRKRGPLPCSLYLEQLVHNNAADKDKSKAFYINLDNLFSNHGLKHNTSEDIISQAIRDTQVFHTKDNTNWDWDLIGYILKWPDDKLKRLEEQSHLRFIKRLVYFFKPTNHLFSRIGHDCENGKKIALVGCQLLKFLLRCSQEEATKQLMDFLVDVALCLSELSAPRIDPESVLSPINIQNTLSHYYFLFIGSMSASVTGDRYLEKTSIYQHLLAVVTATTQDSYIKLIVSCLSYTKDGNTRAILSKALCGSSESARLYTTKLMRVLLRTKSLGFQTWGIEYLVTQLYDQSRAVAMMALSVLEEACEVVDNLYSLVKLRPSFLQLGEKGVLILCRFMSIPKGFKFLMDANYTMTELKKWHQKFNTRYVDIVEEMLNEALTTYEKKYEGSYTRCSSRKRKRKDVFVPVHLYGELVQHKEGYNLLRQQEHVSEYFHCIRCQELQTAEDILKLKSALWAVGHIGTSSWGISWLQELKIVPEIIRLAEESGVFSVRGTAFFVLGLLASTREGAEALTQYGWESCWKSRTDPWPVVEDRTVLLEAAETTPVSETSFSMIYSNSRFESPLNIGDTKLTFPSHPNGGNISLDSNSNIYQSGCEKKEQFCDTSPTKFHSLSPDSRHLGSVGKSRTLPLESHSYKRYQTFPSRSQSLHTVLLMSPSRERALSDDLVIMEEKHISGLVGHESEEVDVEEEQTIIQEGLVLKIPVHSANKLIISQRDRASSDSAIQTGNFEKGVSKSEESLPKEINERQNQESKGLEEQDQCEESDQSNLTELSSKIKTVDDSSKKPISIRDEKSSGSESSRTSKSRADSFNTDSTTSGISSYDSGHHGVSEFRSLSPIASSTSLEHIEPAITDSLVKLDDKELVHPSSTQRKLANLNRVPSLRRQSSPGYGILPSSRFFDFSENAIMYTTTRDAVGYATLRSLMKQRQSSSEFESDYGLSKLYEANTSTSVSRRQSIDSRTSLESFSFRLGPSRNPSGISLSDWGQDGSFLHQTPATPVPKTSLYQQRPHTGGAEFIGLTLPVNINMIFEVHEGEDKRAQVSSLPEKTWVNLERSRSERSDSGLDEILESKLKLPGKDTRSRTASTNTDVLQLEHQVQICIQCTHAQCVDEVEEEKKEGYTESEESQFLGALQRGSKGSFSRTSSFTEQPTTNEVSGSLTSNVSESNSAFRKLSLDHPQGRALLRKEMLRLVLNLSSSVGVKASEQGLLSLKQKFPKAFQDLCFYSEVSDLLGSCSFRLTARRFIQELFDDLDISRIREEPMKIMGIMDESSIPTKSKPVALIENFDDSISDVQ